MSAGGDIRFYKGKECVNCGGTERYVSNRKCRTCNITNARVINHGRRVVNEPVKGATPEQIAQSVVIGNRMLAMKW
jgi:hypothetical protein